MTDKHSSDYSLANTRGVTEAEKQLRAAIRVVDHLQAENGYDLHDLDHHLVHALAVLRGPEPKVKASKQELVAALVEVRDRCARVADARSVARRVLGDG